MVVVTLDFAVSNLIMYEDIFTLISKKKCFSIALISEIESRVMAMFLGVY